MNIPWTAVQFETSKELSEFIVSISQRHYHNQRQLQNHEHQFSAHQKRETAPHGPVARRIPHMPPPAGAQREGLACL